MSFLREYGLGIAIPFLLVLGGLALLHLVGAGSTPGELVYSVS